MDLSPVARLIIVACLSPVARLSLLTRLNSIVCPSHRVARLESRNVSRYSACLSPMRV